MAYKKRLTTNSKIKINSQDKAIDAHAGFVRFIVSQVQKEGLKNVLQLKKDSELWWLHSAYERVLDFAEEVQLKRIPQKLEGSGENGEFKLVIEIVDENKIASGPGNRISQYIEV